MEDHHIKMHETAKIVGISVYRVHNIIHEQLQMKAVYTMGAAIVNH